MKFLFYFINKTSLNIAVEDSNTEIIKLLLSCPDIDVNHVCDSYKSWGSSGRDFDATEKSIPLCVAIENHDTEIIELLLSKENIDVNMPKTKSSSSYHQGNEGNNGDEWWWDSNAICKTYSITDIQSPLYLAVSNDDIQTVEHLLTFKNIFINAYSEYGSGTDDDYQSKLQTALHLAIEKKSAKIVQLLLKNENINVNLLQQNYEKSMLSDYDELIYYHKEESAPIHIAIEENYTKDTIIKLLLSNEKLDINKVKNIYVFNNKKNTKHSNYSNSKSDNDDDNNNIEESDQQKFGKFKEEKTALIMAIEKNKPDILLLLLSAKNIDINKPFVSKSAPLVSEESNNKNDHLVENNKKFDEFVKKSREENLIQDCPPPFLDKIKYNTINSSTPLEIATENNNKSIIKLLSNH